MTARSGRKPSLTEPSAPLGSEPVSKSTFARMIDCNKSRITVWCKSGTLIDPAVTTAGRIVPSIAILQLIAAGSMLARSKAAASDPRRSGAADSPNEGISAYDRSRAVLEDLFGCPVVQEYGGVEFGQVAFNVGAGPFNVYSYGGLVWVGVLNFVSVKILLLVPAFNAMDATLEESSTMSGSSKLSTFLHVTLPLMLVTACFSTPIPRPVRSGRSGSSPD